MASNGTGDQANLERLVKRIRWQFRFVPAWGFWLEYREGLWYVAGAAENLRAEYLRSLEDMPETENRSRRFSLREQAESLSAQSWALWGLQRDERLLASPEQFESPDGFPLYQPISENLSEWWPSLASKTYFGTDAIVPAFCACVSSWRARAYTLPRIFVRGSWDVPDLEGLYETVGDALKGRVVRLGPKTWSGFPDTMNPELAWKLTGATACFLEGLERWQKFPAIALFRWANWERAHWHGKDGERYSLPMPLTYFVTGGPLHFENIHPQIKTCLFALEGLL